MRFEVLDRFSGLFFNIIVVVVLVPDGKLVSFATECS
jgi:hypothetical protein